MGLGGSMAGCGGPPLGHGTAGKRRGQQRAHRARSEASQRASEATDFSPSIGRLIGSIFVFITGHRENGLEST